MDLSHNCSLHGGKSEVCDKHLYGLVYGVISLTEATHIDAIIVMKIIMVGVFIPCRSYLIGILSTVSDSEQASVVGVVTRSCIVDYVPDAVQVKHVYVGTGSVFVHVAVITCPTIPIVNTIRQLREVNGVTEGDLRTS